MPVLQHGPASPQTPIRDNQLLALIPRWRWVFFALVAVAMLLAFNGKWRVGRDSAAYRGLAHQLAITGKYIFRDKKAFSTYDDQQDTRYPGMPLVLAGVERLFGRGDLPAVLIVTLSAIATLLLTYRLIKPALPLWLTIAVVFGMGVNGRFLEHANEVLSDMPFLLGVVLTLLAFDVLAKARDGVSRTKALSLLVVGLLLSAAMRPTFWVLALALGGTCIWGLFKPTHAGQTAQDARPRRFACLLTLGILAASAATFLLVLDIREKGSAGYLGKLMAHKMLEQLPQNAYAVFEQTLPESFFGTQLGPGFIPVGGKYWIGFSTIYSLVVIISGVLLFRRNVLWGSFVLLTVLTMAAIGSVPRYFIMILPLLLAGWGLHVTWLSERFKKSWMKEIMAFAALGMVVAPNLISCANLIREQRGLSRLREGLKPIGFMKAYHSGKWDGVEKLAAMIRANVREDQQVFGPEATVLTFLSDRRVFGLGRFLSRRDHGVIWDSKLRKLQPDFVYAIFPDTTDKLYDDKDVVTGKLIRIGMLKPTRTIATAAGYKLCEYEIATPSRKRFRHPPRRHHHPAAATQPKRRRRPAATNPATRPATVPSTRGVGTLPAK